MVWYRAIPFKIKIHWNNLKEFPRNLWNFLPLLWCNRDWDYCFILMFLEKKIELTGNCIAKNNMVVKAPEIKASCDTAVKMLKDFDDKDFMQAHQEWFKQRWGEPHREMTEKATDFGTVYMSTLTFPEVPEEDQAKASEDFQKVYVNAEKDKQQHLVDTFTYIAQCIRGWWD